MCDSYAVNVSALYALSKGKCGRINNKYYMKNSPPYIDLYTIKKITDVYRLKVLEQNYDEFLERSPQILLLYNIFGEYLDIRDALIIQKNRMMRILKLNEYKIMNIVY